MPIHSQDYALVIGINHYPSYQPLNGAIEDAREFANWLTDKNTGGGLPDSHCKRFLSRNRNPPPPAWDTIDRALEEIRDQSKETGARRFYLYFSGHGHAPENEDTCLCLGRWAPSGSSRVALSSREYYTYFMNCLGFQEIVVFLDCCRIRVVSASGGGPGVNCVKPLPTAGQARLFKAFATEYQLLSYEAAVADPGAGAFKPPVVRGHFTRALLAALRGGAASPGGGVRPADLEAYLRLWVPRIANQSQQIQSVDIPQNTLPDDPVSYFGSALPSAPANIVIRFKASRAGEVVLTGWDLAVVKRGLPHIGPWELTLSKGLYLLEDMATGEKKDIRFRPEEGVQDVEF